MRITHTANFATGTSISSETEACEGCSCTCPCDCTDCEKCSPCKDH